MKGLAREVIVKIGLQIPDFTTPGGPARLGSDLATVARTADGAGFEFIAVMDHFFQINSPQSLTRPHPPIMIGGGGEKKTLRLVARYADACNLFGNEDLAHKLDVLRGHCEAEGRDYDDVAKTCYYRFDVSRGTGQVIDELGRLAELGFGTAIGSVAGVWEVTPLEVIGSEIIPAVRNL
jgi:alkanesulfonate monooxygenase SsuD/methylene tetrahydromethanopterin reductase-like flavin-dependent oxidoreductase (luciferase family)